MLSTKVLASLAILLSATTATTQAMSIGSRDKTSVVSARSVSSYSSGISIPVCSIDYTTLSKEHYQRVAFYVTEDVLDYATREQVEDWIDTQINYSNLGLKNSCVDFQQEVAVIRYVESPVNQQDYGSNFTYDTQEVTADVYNDIIASLDVDDLRLPSRTPMGRTGDVINADWLKYSFDRVVSVRPYYQASGSKGSICGVGLGNWSRPNKASPDYMDAPENFWGEVKIGSDAFSTVLYPNDSICSSNDIVAHELGHTNGLSHERSSNPENNHADALGFAASCNGERSIMWSGTGNVRSVPFFSSPNITSSGIPCGSPDTSFGNDSSETLKYQLGTSYKHNSPRVTPFQGVVDPGTSGSVGDTSTWNTITSNRYNNMTVSGEVNFGTMPSIINESNGSFNVEVTRTNTTLVGDVLVRAYGDGNIIAGYDFDFEKMVSFGIGESSKTVTFNTTESGLYRQNGQVTFKLETPYQMILGSTNTYTLNYQPTLSGFSGKVLITSATASCSVTCEGIVQLTRTGGAQGSIEVDLVYRLNGYEIVSDTVTFADGETSKQSNITHTSMFDLTVDVSAGNPSVASYSRAMFSNDDGGSDNGSDSGSSTDTGGSSGGSIGFLGLLMMMMMHYRRK
ncbi:hypothetical protein A1QO_00565 [Vibrio genomosp. F10 str. ZF-129]|uniref:GlyGly-CTERM sorting domain-containing protein n=1 Tax=Vibrio genomosp. F10 str. ZF-129 TaxID=1187848 RepID=A0A1E5BG85_9VIBR|nr:GlyGly-CTERM sorting domain-containing protein [Vibrio genomosp. F10]OEE35284.1 hypothetical protein A1QO_00565 [Vibrio genomosp. F10 str. ZF-129]